MERCADQIPGDARSHTINEVPDCSHHDKQLKLLFTILEDGTINEEGYACASLSLSQSKIFD
jgi:hypothetical protein